MQTALKALVVPVLMVLPATAWARDVPVSDANELRNAIATAAPGDVIVLAPGEYVTGNITCVAQGTQVAPVVVKAVFPWTAQVRFNGTEGFRVRGANWHFEDLDIQGVCADDNTCEHAFHVTGQAEGFVMRGCRVRDFNAQLKVNADQLGGVWHIPHRGVVERNELGDTRPRQTSNPVTKLNIDTGDDWLIRDNLLHDFHKAGGDGVSYGAFLKSGGNRGLMERNLVMCTRDVNTGGTRIGLSLGGGGTAPEFCAPAFDANTPCDVEHRDGIIRNNIIIGCSDVGIYLNRAANTRVLANTLVATSGVDYRFVTTSGEAAGNLLSNVIRTRDSATLNRGTNLENVSNAQFAGWYADPDNADLSVVGDVSALIAMVPTRTDIPTDYCARPRPNSALTLGALEHSLGSCSTTWPWAPEIVDAGMPMPDAAMGTDAAPARDAAVATDAGVPDAAVRDAAMVVADAGAAQPDAGGGGSSAGDGNDDATGCACQSSGSGPLSGLWAALWLGAFWLRPRTRRFSWPS